MTLSIRRPTRTLAPRVRGRRCVTSPRLAEVSIKTVSRVINGEPGVAAEMAARVQLAIDRLD